MSTNKIHFNGTDILEKNFKTGMRGYNQVEVDEFLDLIIKDYETFQRTIEQLEHENDRLKKLSNQARTRSTQPNQQVNYDVLKRLSNLEKEVFGKRTSDS